MIKNKLIPIIDLFAGPGGLGEGFSSYFSGNKTSHSFNIKASVEMDTHAHRTLELRSFFREFPDGKAPIEYYSYIKGKISREQLFGKYPAQAKRAADKAIRATLGKPEDDVIIYEKLEKILTENGNKPWVLIGGPPCQAYSTIGRARQQAYTIGKEKYQKDARNFLYKEYLGIIAKFRPTVFVMENVAGILSAKIKDENIFNRIITDLKKPIEAVGVKANGWKPSTKPLEYKIYPLSVEVEDGSQPDPSDYLIKCEDHGIPQARHRVILLGIRSDVHVKPITLHRPEDRIPAGKVLADLPELRSGFSKSSVDAKSWYKFVREITKQSWFTECKEIKLSSGNKKYIELSSVMRRLLKRVKNNLNTGGDFVPGKSRPEYRPEWFSDPRLGGFLNHSSRGHMKEDLYRYFFAAACASVTGKSPLLGNFPIQLLPNHKNAKIGKGTQIMFDDRFRVVLKNEPAKTITCHMSKDGHYSIHYDPLQCRSLTVREAARIQTFPDNYYFEGPRTEKYRQVGNAVPPLLAYQIANIVHMVIQEYGRILDTKTNIKSISKAHNYIFTSA